jgi:AraC-like DNA-binding protein
MAKTTTSSAREARDLSSLLRASKGEALPYRQFFEQLKHALPISEGLVLSTLPRGGLQITQPPRLAENLLRGYTRQFHAEDRPTWQAISRRRPVRGRECWAASDYESTSFYRGFLAENGLYHMVAAPLTAPVLEGYPGALQLYRNAEQGDFSDAEMGRIESLARDLDEAIDRSRSSRRTVICSRLAGFDPSFRQFIFDGRLNLAYPRDDRGVDDRLREEMLDYARFRLGHVNGKAVESDRVSLPDLRGDLLHFRVVVHKTYPALGDGPFIFFCYQPTCADWSALRPTDFQADPDVARLVPAMKYMRDHFHRVPTLTEISKAAHLSPFHFHRRFTEIFGITPKHFMLDCQIEYAKCELLGREKELAAIAKACGFAHQSHFTSRFKQATGLTPTRWRRMASESKRARN